MARIVLVVALALACPAFAGAQPAERHVFVTVLDAAGAPIEGLTAEHFAVREGGKDRDVVKVEPLRIPMHVALLVDTNVGGGVADRIFLNAVAEFAERLAAFNQVAVYSFGGRAAPVVAFTQDPPRLRTAISNLVGSAQGGSYLMDAIDLALVDFSRIETPRPVVIAITTETAEASRRSAGSVIKRLIAQSIAFHAVAMASATGSSSSTPMARDIPSSSARLQGMIALGEGDRERAQVLQQGSTATGGSTQRMTSTMALAPALTRLAQELGNSYQVTFARPGNDKLKDLQVGIMLEGVTLRATAAPFGTR